MMNSIPLAVAISILPCTALADDGPAMFSTDSLPEARTLEVHDEGETLIIVAVADDGTPTRSMELDALGGVIVYFGPAGTGELADGGSTFSPAVQAEFSAMLAAVQNATHSGGTGELAIPTSIDPDINCKKKASDNLCWCTCTTGGNVGGLAECVAFKLASQFGGGECINNTWDCTATDPRACDT